MHAAACAVLVHDKNRKSPKSAQLCADVDAPMVRGCHIFHVIGTPTKPDPQRVLRGPKIYRCHNHRHVGPHSAVARSERMYVHAKNLTSTNRVRVRIYAYLTKSVHGHATAQHGCTCATRNAYTQTHNTKKVRCLFYFQMKKRQALRLIHIHT